MTSIDSFHYTPTSGRRDLEHAKQEIVALVDELARIAATAKAGACGLEGGLERDAVEDLFLDLHKRISAAADRCAKLEDALQGPALILRAA